MAFPWDAYKSDRWTPEQKGDRIKGVITQIRVEKNTKNEDVPVVTLLVKGREIEVHCSAILLRTAVADLEPQIGDGLELELVELRHTGQKSPLKVYGVKHVTAAEIERLRLEREGQ